MVSQRNAHYWLWFLIFGIVSVAIGAVGGSGLTSESVWLLVAGFLGLLFGRMATNLARPYDVIAGIIFTVVGVLGVLHNFNVALPSSVDTTTLIGLSMSLPYALIHTVLGLGSLNLAAHASSGVPAHAHAKAAH